MRKHLAKVLIGIATIVILLVLAVCFFPGKETEDTNLNQSTGVSTSQNQTQQGDEEKQQERSEFIVSFLSGDGSLLSTCVVKKGENAVPPTAPVMPAGYTFSHWDTDFSNVQQDLEVRAVCVEIPQNCNVFVLESASGYVGENVTLSLRLTGDVCLAGVDLVMNYDTSSLEFVEMAYEDELVLTNVKPEKGTILLNYLGSNNTTGEVDLCDCVFRIKGDVETTTVEVVIESAVALDEREQFYKPQCETINAAVIVLH